jgi:hypothetical protein
VYGWEAVGFGTGQSGSTPTNYSSFIVVEQCWGCHGDSVDCSTFGPCVANIRIEPQGIQPKAATSGAVVEIIGDCFGDTLEQGYTIQLKKTQWIDLSTDVILQWANDRIQFSVPYPPEGVGNYSVRVVKAHLGHTNHVTLTVKDGRSYCTNPASGPCKTVVRLRDSSGPFGPGQDTISSPGASDGIYRILEVLSSQGVYTALNIRRWNQTLVKFTFKDFYEDLEPRNYVQDVGESVISACSGMGLETYTVRVRSVFYEDTDSSGSFTAGDSIIQTEVSSPRYFELTNEPGITALKPRQHTNGSRLRILGVNFEDNQGAGEIRIGTRKQYKTDPFTKGLVMDRVRLWTDNKIVVWVRARDAWQGKTKYIWVVKDGMVSNYKKVEILAPAP